MSGPGSRVGAGATVPEPSGLGEGWVWCAREPGDRSDCLESLGGGGGHSASGHVGKTVRVRAGAWRCPLLGLARCLQCGGKELGDGGDSMEG